MPIAIAAAIVGRAGAMWVSFFRGDEVTIYLVGRAVVGQNDDAATQELSDFQTHTCVAQQGSGNQVLTDQRQSKSARATASSTTSRISTPTVIGPLPRSSTTSEDARRQDRAHDLRPGGRLEGVSPGPR